MEATVQLMCRRMFCITLCGQFSPYTVCHCHPSYVQVYDVVVRCFVLGLRIRYEIIRDINIRGTKQWYLSVNSCSVVAFINRNLSIQIITLILDTLFLF
jgi:hypothetical protein